MIIFRPTRKNAEELYARVYDAHTTCHLAVENFGVIDRDRYKVREYNMPLCYLTYARGNLGLGTNVEGLTFAVIDANSYRPLSSFAVAGELTAEEFERAQAQERARISFENAGRLFRGKTNHRVVLVVLNADEEFKKAIVTAPYIIEGCEEPPIVATGDLPQLVDQADRWLDHPEEGWPEPRQEPPRPRRGPNTKRSPESIVAAAETAIAEGQSWRAFYRKNNLRRGPLDPKALDALQARFLAVNARTNTETPEDAGGVRDQGTRGTGPPAHEPDPPLDVPF